MHHICLDAHIHCNNTFQDLAKLMTNETLLCQSLGTMKLRNPFGDQLCLGLLDGRFKLTRQTYSLQCHQGFGFSACKFKVSKASSSHTCSGNLGPHTCIIAGSAWRNFTGLPGRSSDLLLRIESVEQANRNVKARLKAMDPRELIDTSLGILYSERNQICASRNLKYTRFGRFDSMFWPMTMLHANRSLWNILSDTPSKLIEDTHGKAGRSIQKESCEKRKMRAS